MNEPLPDAITIFGQCADKDDRDKFVQRLIKHVDKSEAVRAFLAGVITMYVPKEVAKLVLAD